MIEGRLLLPGPSHSTIQTNLVCLAYCTTFGFKIPCRHTVCVPVVVFAPEEISEIYCENWDRLNSFSWYSEDSLVWETIGE